MRHSLREEDENGRVAERDESHQARGEGTREYTLGRSNEVRSRLFDMLNSSPKLTLVRPEELIAATRQLVSARRKLVFHSHLSLLLS
jgi:hypothetical protein